MSVIFKDENESWQIDFSSAIWATDKLHEIFSVIKDSFLSDVDFVAETKDFVLFVESKNSNFKEAKHKFKPHETEKIISVARKYYDSLVYIRSLIEDRNKKKIYIYLLESRNGDTNLRKSVRNRLKDRLPFKLQRNDGLYETMIDDFDVLSFAEWNKRFKQFPAERLKNPVTDNG